jgi:lipopolysaccharide export system permease protein
VWSAALFYLDDRVLAQANRKADALENQIRGNPPRPADTIATAHWLTDARGRVYYYALYDLSRQTLHGLSVFDVARTPYRVTSHTFAAKAVFSGGQWRATDGWVQHFSTPDRATRDRFTARSLALDVPSSFSGLHNRSSDLLSFGELRQQIAQMSGSGVNLAESRVTLQERIAFPLVTLVMTILGVPFGATTGRRGALYGIGVAIILGSAYWLLNTFFVAVGQASLLSPVLAAWAANVLFLAAAVYLTLTVRT